MLERPYLFFGSFSGQVCVGMVLLTAALCLPPEREVKADDPSVSLFSASVTAQPVFTKTKDVRAKSS